MVNLKSQKKELGKEKGKL